MRNHAENRLNGIPTTSATCLGAAFQPTRAEIQRASAGTALLILLPSTNCTINMALLTPAICLPITSSPQRVLRRSGTLLNRRQGKTPFPSPRDRKPPPCKIDHRSVTGSACFSIVINQILRFQRPPEIKLPQPHLQCQLVRPVIVK